MRSPGRHLGYIPRIPRRPSTNPSSFMRQVTATINRGGWLLERPFRSPLFKERCTPERVCHLHFGAVRLQFSVLKSRQSFPPKTRDFRPKCFSPKMKLCKLLGLVLLVNLVLLSTLVPPATSRRGMSRRKMGKVKKLGALAMLMKLGGKRKILIPIPIP